MKKQFLQLSLAASLGLPAVSIAQNVFPTNGNVGIGTTVPDAQLEILQRNADDKSVLDVVKAAGGAEAPIFRVWRDNGKDGNGNYVNNNIALAVYRSGYIGIGTSSPQAKLQIGHAATGTVSDTPGAAQLLSLNSHYAFRASGLASEALHLDTYNSGWSVNPILTVHRGNRNMGIGTANPTLGKLDIRGDSSLPALSVSKGVGGGNVIVAYVNNPYVEETTAFRVTSTREVVVGNTARNDAVLRLHGTAVFNGQLVVGTKLSCQTLELTSDENVKEKFEPVSAAAVLAKVANLPITTWAYTNSPGVRHIGPMAQGLKAAFPELGEDDKHIGAGDGIGVALAAIQGLNEKVESQNAELAELKTRNASLERQVAAVTKQMAGMQEVVAALAKAMPQNGVQQASIRPEATR